VIAAILKRHCQVQLMAVMLWLGWCVDNVVFGSGRHLFVMQRLLVGWCGGNDVSGSGRHLLVIRTVLVGTAPAGHHLGGLHLKPGLSVTWRMCVRAAAGIAT
jgi:hypothetical protein